MAASHNSCHFQLRDAGSWSSPRRKYCITFIFRLNPLAHGHNQNEKQLHKKVSKFFLIAFDINIAMTPERDYAPLSAACVRSLSDKLYEKRKAAALEIEK